MTEEQIEERLRTGDHNNDALVRWCRQRLEGRLNLGERGDEALNRALSTNLPPCRIQLASIRYRGLQVYPHRLERLRQAGQQDLLPIVLARPAGGDMWVLDGRHRCEAAERRGRKSIRAVIVDVDGRFTWPGD